MKTETEKPDLTALTKEQLKSLYHQTNSQLARNLLSGRGIDGEAARIEMLTHIAEELNRRNFATDAA